MFDVTLKGIILSSFYWGYAPTQLFYGSLAERYGGKYFLGQAILIPSLLSLSTPWLIVRFEGDYKVLVILRILMGASSSAMFPTASQMIPHWTIPANRTRFATFINSGSIFGPILGTLLPALIIEYGGSKWKGVFYFFGTIGLIWFVLWTVLCYDDPKIHPFITKKERLRLQQGNAMDHVCDDVKNKPAAPWSHILRSKQFWAFVIGLFGLDWTYLTLTSDLPKYMSSVVGLTVEQNGYLSTLPYVSMWLNSILCSWLVDLAVTKDWTTNTRIKKILSIVAISGSATFVLIAVCVQDNDKILVTAFLIFGMTLVGCGVPTIMINNLDLSPNYAGSLMSVGNGAAALGGILSPYIVGVLLSTDPTDWIKVFWFGFFVALCSSCYVFFFSSSKVQYWNNPYFNRDSERRNENKTNCRENQSGLD